MEGSPRFTARARAARSAGELGVKEKLSLLHAAMRDYDSQDRAWRGFSMLMDGANGRGSKKLES